MVNRIITGDALDIVGRQGGILLHQTNCLRMAGAGIALQIRQRWPAWYEAFRQDTRKLGDATFIDVQTYPRVVIGNLYAQYAVGRSSQQTSYAALETALDITKKHLSRLTSESTGITFPVYLPFGIGCGLGGGDWAAVQRIVAARLPDATFVKLPEIHRSR